MKKIIISMLVLFMSYFGNSQDLAQSKYFSDFLSDPQVAKVLSNSPLPDNVLQLIDPSKYYIRTQGDEKKPMGYIQIFGNGKLVGVIHFAKVDEKYKTADGSKYLIAWRNYSKVSQQNGKLNGIVEIYDLNKKGLLFQTAEITDSQLTSWNDIGDVALVEKTHPCDLNGNGNVGFQECYRCMKTACSGSAGSDFMCDLTNIAFGWCTASMTISCIYLSIKY